MLYPKPLSEKSIAIMYEKLNLSSKKIEFLHDFYETCSNLYAWPVIWAGSRLNCLRKEKALYRQQLFWDLGYNKLLLKEKSIELNW